MVSKTDKIFIPERLTGKINHTGNEHHPGAKRGGINLVLRAFLPHKTVSSFGTKGCIITISVAPGSSESLVHLMGTDFSIVVREGHEDLCWRILLLNIFLQEGGFSRIVQMMGGRAKTGLEKGWLGMGFGLGTEWEGGLGITYKGEEGQRIWRQNVWKQNMKTHELTP